MNDAKELYLDLLKQCLTGLVYDDDPFEPVGKSRGFFTRKILQILNRRGLALMRHRPYDANARAEGRDRPATAHTMIGLKRLDNLQFCVEDVLAKNIPGDLIEAGVWRGGASIFMRAILKAGGVRNRFVWVADSFEGLPRPNARKYPPDTGSWFHTQEALSVPLEQVRANFHRYGLLDEQVRFLKGWFRDTLPTTAGHRWALIRVDGDMYESTMDALMKLYPNLSVGGYVIIDDYGAIPACRQAVHDYRERQSIKEEIRPIDWTGVFWRRGDLP